MHKTLSTGVASSTFIQSCLKMDEKDVFRKTKTSCSDRPFGDVENGIEKSDFFTFLFIIFVFVGGIVAAFSFGKMYENVASSGC